jgi:hypothetical protein
VAFVVPELAAVPQMAHGHALHRVQHHLGGGAGRPRQRRPGE